MSKSKEKYDLIFSIGEACLCTEILRINELQLFSYPLDWLFGSDFIGRCTILASEFERFLEENDLEYSYSERSIYCDAYYNRYNKLTFNHDFETKKQLKETYPKVKEKYNRRINRLLDNINNANKILLVYIESPTTQHEKIPDDTILKGFNIVQSHFEDKEIHLLYISNSDKEHYTKEITKFVCREQLEYKLKDNNVPDYSYNSKILRKALSRYQLNVPIAFRIKRIFIKYIIKCIPLKHLRKKFRKKYHIKK